VLVMPHSGQLPSVGRNVLVAWNASNEATRAITDALPLLKRAKTVTVLVVNPSHGFAEHGQVPGADIALYLARHGVNAEVSCDENVEADIGEWLLSRAADLGSDLIVMGAYGHRRLREWALGGATRTLAGEMTVPVLMSH
jgi:nucleotide-binding universal stress UspA family protein